MEVVHLLREITNIEMDLRFEAAAANELFENTKNDKVLKFQNLLAIHIKKVLTLDKVDGVSIRDHRALKEKILI